LFAQADNFAQAANPHSIGIAAIGLGTCVGESPGKRFTSLTHKWGEFDVCRLSKK
jgi:hypothetical protein